jgi:hypothetical protein
MSPPRVWCQYELNWFDLTEIEVWDDFGQVHVRNCSDGVAPHTLTGLIVNSSLDEREMTGADDQQARRASSGADV